MRLAGPIGIARTPNLVSVKLLPRNDPALGNGMRGFWKHEGLAERSLADQQKNQERLGNGCRNQIPKGKGDFYLFDITLNLRMGENIGEVIISIVPQILEIMQWLPLEAP
jgi:hypothetical protein